MAPLRIHRVRAVNTAPDSENKIHDDRVAAEYGFRGGLVPGITIYGYMVEPLLTFAPEWLEHGSMQFRLFEPFYEGDEVNVTTEPLDDGAIAITAAREDGMVGAKGTAVIHPSPADPPALLPEAPLPPPDRRPAPTRETVVPGALLGIVTAVLDTADPARLLKFSNEVLMQNFRLGPWIHAASELRNWSAAQLGDVVSARARVHERFDRKGHEFVVVDVQLIANQQRLLQTVRHTAIYRIRAPQPA